MSFIFISVAGASAIISKEIDVWKDRAKAKRISERLDPYGEGDGWGFFSKDDLKRNATADLGIVPVVGEFAEKAAEDAWFDTYDNGVERDTGTWMGAGVDAVGDLISIGFAGADYGAAQAATEATKQAALEGGKQASIEGGKELVNIGAEIATETALQQVANAPAQVSGFGEFLGNLTDVAASAKDSINAFVEPAKNFVAPAREAVSSLQETIKTPFVDALGQEMGEAAFDVTGSTVGKSALGAASDPDNPGRGAATGALSGLAGGLVDVGAQSTFDTFGKEISGAIGKPIAAAVQPAVQMGQSAIAQALTPQDPAQTYLKNPYGADIWNNPYAAHIKRGKFGI